MDEIEIPQYFLCPISLQIMKDPVTTVTGITYDRESIEQWLSAAAQPSTTCPITKQPLHRDSDLTPNHMLSRLIQSWCIANDSGIDRIPTPKSPINKSNVVKLIRDLENPVLYANSLKKMDELTSESEKNRKCMAETGAAKAMITFVLRRFREGNIMKDPVTTVTGITYDRESIEQWLSAAAQPSTTCPITKQPLHRDSDLTPNHMLSRLIQAWCIANDSGIDRIPTPKSPINKSNVVKLIRDLENPVLYMNSLKKIDELTSESEQNRKCMAETGAAKAMNTFILRRFREGNTTGLEEALRILHLTWNPTPENKQLFKENFEFLQSIIWILKTESENSQTRKTQAVIVLKMITEIASSSLLERLKLDFFKELLNILRKTISQQAIKSVLQTLIEVCPLGRNRMKIVEAGAIFHLIEMELSGHRQEKKSTTELIFYLLAQLCSCADGRAQLIKHAGGIAMVSKRLLRVSTATDDKSLHILALISRFSATREVLMEMLSVGAVSKICMVIQADCADYLQKKARDILRLHSNVWSNSPCIQVYLLTRYPR
ncbi:unnamed protein product [Fraxinus pennsylvanica]|uniref:U-box domain-containing protein n=1 Tax=Fraxinus pennsylvanica TaxID=56036 RepID=A0AAD2DXM7_9LAMI|nr:unnamed protein product [Fraxinus pennsylvanica]